MKFLALISLVMFIPLSWAQEYRLSGSYLLNGSVKAPVDFTLRWKQDENRIQGEYSDDYYTKKAQVAGTVSTGSNFTVTLPATSKGVKSITILGPQLEQNATGRTVPVTVVTRDINGNPLTTTEVSASFIAISEERVAEAQEAGPDCVGNFGELANVCGVYGGLVTEENDPSQSCDLTNAPAVRLEVDFLGEVRLHLDEVNELTVTPAHELGRLPANPTSTSIDLLNRECRTLARAAFAPDNCKRLNLTGTFSEDDGKWHFTGSYLIVDEKTNRSCRYRLSLNQEQS